jgi:alkanesulfonate monooxygenase SsuD/methylene tetrahydromethanopterin reductase-like flavin-dependent oxidoreductase (luciferase family)
VKLDAGFHGPLKDAGSTAAELESAGYDGIVTAETAHDPFLPLVLAADRTERIDRVTGIGSPSPATPCCWPTWVGISTSSPAAVS